MAFHPFNYLTEHQIFQILENLNTDQPEFPPDLFQRSNSGRRLNVGRAAEVARETFASGGHEALSRLTDHLLHRNYSGGDGLEARRMMHALVTHYATQDLNRSRSSSRWLLSRIPDQAHTSPNTDLSALEHPDLPHHSNASREAEKFREEIFSQLAAGTHQPSRQSERVVDLSLHARGISEHPELEGVKRIDLGAMSRSAKAFDIDKATRQSAPHLIAAEDRNDETIATALGIDRNEIQALHGERLGKTQELSRRHASRLEDQVAHERTQRAVQTVSQQQQLIAQQQELLAQKQQEASKQQELLGREQRDSAEKTNKQLNTILQAATYGQAPEEQISTAPLVKASSVNTLQSLKAPASSRIPRQKSTFVKESMDIYVKAIQKQVK
jgi:hypothetical protein